MSRFKPSPDYYALYPLTTFDDRQSERQAALVTREFHEMANVTSTHPGTNTVQFSALPCAVHGCYIVALRLFQAVPENHKPLAARIEAHTIDTPTKRRIFTLRYAYA